MKRREFLAAAGLVGAAAAVRAQSAALHVAIENEHRSRARRLEEGRRHRQRHEFTAVQQARPF